MVRIVYFVVIFSVSYASISAAPIPSGADRPPLYFPTKVGTKWVYQYPESREVIDEIVESELLNGKHTVTVQYIERDGNPRVFEKLVVSDEGLSVLEEPTCTYKSPLQWIKTKAKPEEKWNVNTDSSLRGLDVGSFSRIGSIKFVGTEKVKVPAGEFTTIRMEAKGERGWAETRWYAPGVGMVKWISPWNVTIELKSFTLGKK